jgi:hypothetical protein
MSDISDDDRCFLDSIANVHVRSLCDGVAPTLAEVVADPGLILEEIKPGHGDLDGAEVRAYLVEAIRGVARSLLPVATIMTKGAINSIAYHRDTPIEEIEAALPDGWSIDPISEETDLSEPGRRWRHLRLDGVRVTDGDSAWEIEAPAGATAAEIEALVVDSIGEGYHVDLETVPVWFQATRGSITVSGIVELDPEEPACDDDDGHDWEADGGPHYGSVRYHQDASERIAKRDAAARRAAVAKGEEDGREDVETAIREGHDHHTLDGDLVAEGAINAAAHSHRKVSTRDKASYYEAYARGAKAAIEEASS